MITLTVARLEDTHAIATTLVRALTPGDIVLLAGDLGAGKTAFVQGAARALGVTTRVTSPTFVIAREYAGAELRVVHVDAYRLDVLSELADLGFEELTSSDAVTFIEWGDTVARALPARAIRVTIGVADAETRTITIDSDAPDVRARLEEAFAPARGDQVRA